MHEVLVNRLGGLSLSRKSVVRLTDRPDMILDVYRGRKTTMQKQQQINFQNFSRYLNYRSCLAISKNILSKHVLLIVFDICYMYIFSYPLRGHY